MLSDDLFVLAARFREHEFAGGVTLTRRQARRIATLLAQYTLDAGALERHVVPPAARVDPATAGASVLPFPLAGRIRAGEIRGTPREPEPAA